MRARKSPELFHDALNAGVEYVVMEPPLPFDQIVQLRPAAVPDALLDACGVPPLGTVVTVHGSPPVPAAPVDVPPVDAPAVELPPVPMPPRPIPAEPPVPKPPPVPPAPPV